VHQLRGTNLGHLVDVGTLGEGLVEWQHLHLNGCGRLTCHVEAGGLTACLDGPERHWIVLAASEKEGALGSRVLLHLRKAMVGGIHQTLRGAVVGVQRVQSLAHGLPGLEVGVDVRPTEGIDGLFRVADQNQAAVLPIRSCLVDAVEDVELNRVGVLEFVDQGHRELRANDVG
jgi:hypothetical protein